jgi:hypothetical protein
VSRKLDNGRILDSEPKADNESRLNIKIIKEGLHLKSLKGYVLELNRIQ